MMSRQTPDLSGFTTSAITRIVYSNLLQFLDISPDALIVANHIGTIVLMNELAAHLFGYSREELVGQQLEILLPMRFRATHSKYRDGYFAAPLTRPMGAGLQLFGLHKTGNEFPVDISLKPLLLNDLPHAIGAIRDVTQQKALEEQMAAKMLELERVHTIHTLFDSTYDAIVLVSPNGRLIEVNRRFARLLGLPAEELAGHPIAFLFPYCERVFKDPEIFSGFIKRSMQDTTQTFSIDIVQQPPSQTEYQLTSIAVSTPDRKYIGRFFSLRDVTHERQVDRMKSEVISLISHELRTPLTSVKGFVDILLEEQGEGALRGEQRDFLQIVQDETLSLVALINDMLDVSQIETGKLALESAVFELRSVIDRVIQALQLQISSKGQHITIEMEQPDLRVWGDANRVSQIFTNLLSNAHKYTPADGTIRLSAHTQEAFVRIEVSDNGVGMTQEEQGRLFTRFYRAKNRLTQAEGGTGLGLMIARSLIELHGGTIRVESTPGKGTTFFFTLPLAPGSTSHSMSQQVPDISA